MSQGALLARKFPIQVAVVGISILAIEKWRYVHTVNVCWKRWPLSCNGSKCRHEISKINEVGNISDRHPPRLIDDEWHLDAPFIELAFTSFQSGTAIKFLEWCHNSSTIIRGKYDQCVLSQSQIVKRSQEAAYIGIHMCDKCSIPLGVGSLTVKKS